MHTKKNKNSKMKTVPHKKFKVDRNQLLSYILAGLIIFWTVASVFGFIAYGRTSKSTAKSSTISASAQTADSIALDGYLEIELPLLEGFTIYDGYTSVIRSAPTLLLYSDSLKFRDEEPAGAGFSVPITRNYCRVLSSDNTAIYHTVTVERVLAERIGTHDYSYPNLFDIDDIYLDYKFEHNSRWLAIDVFITLYVVYNGVVHDYTFCIHYGYGKSPNLDLACYSIPYLAYTWSFDAVKTFGNYPAYGVPTAQALRYYRLAGTSSPDATLTYELAYNNGYKQGKQVGAQEAINNAYDAGVEEGKVDGYNDGFIEGKAVGYEQGLGFANDYTFSNLLSAVFNVPVTAFSSLFDFELLGVNLFNFLSALFTAGLIICIIRLIL